MLYNVRTPVVYHDCNGMAMPGQRWNNVCGPIATTRDWAIQPHPTNTNGWIALQLLRHNTTPVQRPGVFSDAGRCAVPKKEVAINPINLCGELAVLARHAGRKSSVVGPILNRLTPFLAG